MTTPETYVPDDHPLLKDSLAIGPPVSLGHAFRYFLRYTTPRVLVCGAVGFWAFRFVLGGWTSWDAVMVAAIFAFWPFQEWLLHVYLLHGKPKKIFGRTIDPLPARKHRRHHRDPRITPLIFIIEGVALGGLIIYPSLFFAITWDLRLAIMGAAVFFAFALNYEWTHFLVHTTYKPKTAYFKRRWMNHRLHHYRNENYWYGVSMLFADKVLGTQPRRDDVPLSETCFTLGAEDTLGSDREVTGRAVDDLE